MRKRFSFFKEYREFVSLLSDKDRLRVYDAIIKYSLDGKEDNIGELQSYLEKVKDFNLKRKEHKKGVRIKRGRKRKMSYADYLSSKHWKEFRRYVISTRGNCEVCGASQGLQVHHKWYGTRRHSVLKREVLGDVAVLCKECHSKYHLEYASATKENFKSFFKKYARGSVVRIIKKGGLVIDMGKAAEKLKERK